MPPTSSKSHRGVSAHLPRAYNNGEGSAADTALTRLEAHAAVRLDPLLGKAFDCYGLPQRRSDKDQRGRFSFIKSMKGLASYLTTRINPSFQECLIRVVETESDVRFEVRQISNGKGTRARVLFTASLSTLVDVARDSVIEKDTVVFSQLPSTFQPTDEGNSSTLAGSSGGAAAAEGRRSGKIRSPRSHHHTHNGGASKKEELISTLFSAYGDIGLNLVFHAARVEEDKLTHHHRHHRHPSSARGSGGGGGGNNTARPYTRIGLRFVSTAERNEWLAFCSEAYMGLLLDSIRMNRDTVYVPDDAAANLSFAAAPTATATNNTKPSDTFHLEKPSEEAVENYIDFFLSAHTKADGNTNNNNNNSSSNNVSGSHIEADPLSIPFGGTLHIRGTDGSLHTRHVDFEREDDDADEAGLPVTRASLVLRRKRWSGKYESQRIPLAGLQVYADDDQTGTSFFLEFLYRDTSAADRITSSARSDRTSVTQQLFTLGAVQQQLCGTQRPGAQDTVTLECETGSFAARRQWLQWLEVVLKKQVVYLSVARRNAEAQKPVGHGTHTGLLGDRVVW